MSQLDKLRRLIALEREFDAGRPEQRPVQQHEQECLREWWRSLTDIQRDALLKSLQVPQRAKTKARRRA
jgi:hypothetical protein